MRILVALCFAAVVAAPAAAQNGEALFKARCSSCHQTKAGAPSSLGPNLSGIVGAKAGSGQYRYSAALRSSGVLWDAKSLDRWLIRPSALVPGTKMFTSVPDPASRQAIINYLSGLKK